MAWNQDDTRSHIAGKYGHEQLDLARPCLRSIHDRLLYARIHYQDAEKTIDAFVQEELQEQPLIVAIAGDEERWQAFNVFIRKVGAHLTACIQSIHSLPDILAHAVYYSLALNLARNAMTNRQINAHTVIDNLARIPEYREIHDAISSIVHDDEYRHLSALANRAKHQSIVFPSLSEDWSGEHSERHAVKFPSFEHHGKVFPQVIAKEFLSAEYQRCSRIVIQVGVELNNVLANG